MENTPPIAQAVNNLGGQSATARAVGVSQATVWYWLKEGRVSAEYCQKLAVASGVPAHELRPDIFTPPGDAAPAQSETQGA